LLFRQKHRKFGSMPPFPQGTPMAQASPALRSELAPTGTLRVGINLGNFLLTAKDPKTGEFTGVAVDLGKEIASRLGVSVEVIGYPNPGTLADAKRAGRREFGAEGGRGLCHRGPLWKRGHATKLAVLLPEQQMRPAYENSFNRR